MVLNYWQYTRISSVQIRLQGFLKMEGFQRSKLPRLEKEGAAFQRGRFLIKQNLKHIVPLLKLGRREAPGTLSRKTYRDAPLPTFTIRIFRHFVSARSCFLQFVIFFRPSLFNGNRSARDCKSVRRNVFGNDGACSGESAVSHCYRRYQDGI